jgi:hypothetical protein
MLILVIYGIRFRVRMPEPQHTRFLDDFSTGCNSKPNFPGAVPAVLDKPHAA